MASDKTCPKCHAAMVEGFLLEQTAHSLAVSSWVEGKPKPSWWTGLKFDKNPIPVTTWRCGSCGFLESYATG